MISGLAQISVPLIGKINTYIVNPLILLLIALAVMTFLFGLGQYIGNMADDGKRTEAKNHMLWGIIGLFIMVSVFGILRVVCGTITVTC